MHNVFNYLSILRLGLFLHYSFIMIGFVEFYCVLIVLNALGIFF